MVKNVLLYCKSVKLWGFCQACGVFHRALMLCGSFGCGHLNTWLLHSCGYAGCWDRMILIFYKETCISQVMHSSSILTVKYSCSPCAPSANLTNYKCSTLKQVNPFNLSTCGLISVLSLWGSLINRAGIGWKEFFLEREKLLHVLFCTFKEKWDGGDICHSFKLQGVPVARVVAFAVCFLPMNDEYSHIIP